MKERKPPKWPKWMTSDTFTYGTKRLFAGWLDTAAYDDQQGAPGVVSIKPREWFLVGPDQEWNTTVPPEEFAERYLRFPSIKSAFAALVLIYGKPTEEE